MTEVLLSPAAAHPNDTTPVVSLSLVKEALRLPSDITDEDNFLRLLIDSMEIAVESLFGIVLRQRSYSGNVPTLCQYTQVSPLPISTAPVVTYAAKDLTTKTVTLTDFVALPRPVIYIKNPAIIHADLNPDKMNPITITATAGFTVLPKNAQVPIIQAVAYFYKNREVAVMNNEDPKSSLMNHLLQPVAHVLRTSVY